MVTPWQDGKPPNEHVVEVEHEERGIIRVRAMWGRDGMLPHWESEDGATLWEPAAFTRWRPLRQEEPVTNEEDDHGGHVATGRRS